MFLRDFEITSQSFVSDIVNADYRTADVFRDYNMEYCCGAKFPLEMMCMAKGIDMNSLLDDLKKASRPEHLSPLLPFETWNTDFLIDYIINIHHYYIRETLPVLFKELDHFTNEHTGKYPWYETIRSKFNELLAELIQHIDIEETRLFPYLRSVSHAYDRKDDIGSLLVKTLRKPLPLMADNEHIFIMTTLRSFRELTNSYQPPPGACTSHKVVLRRLKEMDINLANHVYLEMEILFPRIIRMETELLDKK